MINIIRITLSVILMTLFGSLGAVCLKKTGLANGGKLFSLFRDKWTYLGAALYISGMVLNIYVLHYLDYSVVLPLTSLTYVWTIILSRLIFGEKVNLFKVLAILFIISGTVLIIL
jgi:drug/metabolite transporter (DMT)-like permease